MSLAYRFFVAIIAVAMMAPRSWADSDEMKFGKISDSEWTMTAPADYPEADALVLWAKGDIDVTLDNITTEYHYRIKILTEAGIEKVGEQSITWNPEDDKIKNFKAHTITPDGKKHDVEKNSIFEKESGTYRIKTFAFPALEPGAIIEYRFKRISDNYYYLEPWYYQSDVYTLESSVSVTLVNGFSYDTYHYNVPRYETDAVVTERPATGPRAAMGEKIKTFTWTRKNLPPITDEPYMSCEKDYRSALRFQIVSYDNGRIFRTFMSSWEELGKIRQKWFDEYCNKDGDIRKITERVTAGLTDDLDKSQAIYDYVTHEYTTTYDYINLFFSRDHIAGLLQDKRGTAEEKNMLLVQMHRAAGIEALPVLISRRSHGKVEVRYPDLRQFDYLIAYVQFAETFSFLHAGDALSSYGVLPPFCLSEIGMLVEGEKSKLVRLNCPPLTSTRYDRTFMRIMPDGLAKCSTVCTFAGYYATDYADRFERETLDEFNSDMFVGRIGVEYDLDTVYCGRDSTGNFTMTAVFTSEDLVTQLDENLLVTPTSFYFRDNPFRSEKRFFPVDFTYPFQYVNEVSIQLDTGTPNYSLPEPLQEQIGGVSFGRTGVANDSCIVIRTQLDLEKAEFSPGQYSQLKEFFDKLSLANSDKVAITMANEE